MLWLSGISNRHSEFGWSSWVEMEVSRVGAWFEGCRCVSTVFADGYNVLDLWCSLPKSRNVHHGRVGIILKLYKGRWRGAVEDVLDNSGSMLGVHAPYWEVC